MMTIFFFVSFAPLSDADDRAFVGGEHALDLRVRLKHRLGDLRPLQLVAGAVLNIDDLDLRVLGLDLVDEAVAPVLPVLLWSGREPRAPTSPSSPISSAILSAATPRRP